MTQIKLPKLSATEISDVNFMKGKEVKQKSSWVKRKRNKKNLKNAISPFVISKNPHTPVKDNFLTLEDVHRLTKLSKETIRTYEKQGKFPKKHKLEGGRVGFDAFEMAVWMASPRDNDRQFGKKECPASRVPPGTWIPVPDQIITEHTLDAINKIEGYKSEGIIDSELPTPDAATPKEVSSKTCCKSEEQDCTTHWVVGMCLMLVSLISGILYLAFFK